MKQQLMFGVVFVIVIKKIKNSFQNSSGGITAPYLHTQDIFNNCWYQLNSAFVRCKFYSRRVSTCSLTSILRAGSNAIGVRGVIYFSIAVPRTASQQPGNTHNYRRSFLSKSGLQNLGENKSDKNQYFSMWSLFGCCSHIVGTTY